jgi:hypothetical protein
MPEAGGLVDFQAEGHEAMMTALGIQSKREITRTRIRVRTAMAAQTREQGRYLGGRPPYGYRQRSRCRRRHSQARNHSVAMRASAPAALTTTTRIQPRRGCSPRRCESSRPESAVSRASVASRSRQLMAAFAASMAVAGIRSTVSFAVPGKGSPQSRRPWAYRSS